VLNRKVSVSKSATILIRDRCKTFKRNYMPSKISELEFYKEIHQNELNRKKNIDSSISFPTTLLTLLIGGGLYLFKKDNFSLQNDDNQYVIFGIIFLTLLFLFSITFAIALLMRMYLNKFRKYKYLPLSSDLIKRENELLKHYEDHFSLTELKKPKKKAIEYSKSEFKKNLLNYYVDFSTNNQLVNDERLKDYYKSRKYLMFSIILIALIGILIILK